jgi:hypothetical protein
MRDSIWCRPHRDHELGPRGAGAPLGNLNAWKHHHHVAPNTLKLIQRAAYDLYENPDKLQEHISKFVEFFYNFRDSDELPHTLMVVACLKVVLEVLVDAYADVCFQAEMDEILSFLAPHDRAAARQRLWEIAVLHSPLNRVSQLRKAKPDFIARQTATPQLPVHPSTSEDRD